jgi:hypothetical protein
MRCLARGSLLQLCCPALFALAHLALDGLSVRRSTAFTKNRQALTLECRSTELPQTGEVWGAANRR